MNAGDVDKACKSNEHHFGSEQLFGHRVVFMANEAVTRRNVPQSRA